MLQNARLGGVFVKIRHFCEKNDNLVFTEAKMCVKILKKQKIGRK
jgi:hypothetical protein